jgi:predicted nuclease with TOPRIM domain
MRTSIGPLGFVLFVTLLIGGCGQDLKKDNEQLKAQVAALQKENLALKGEFTSLKADADAMKKQIDLLIKERREIDEKVKELEARLQVKTKPGMKMHDKPKKMSMS